MLYREIAARTEDAYSADRYGSNEWAACAMLLLERGYSEIETEWVLRSKHMRWAADMSLNGQYGQTGEGLPGKVDGGRHGASGKSGVGRWMPNRIASSLLLSLALVPGAIHRGGMGSCRWDQNMAA